MRPILFIDRDGVVLEEPATDFQIDHIEKTIFVPGVISNLQKIANEFGYYKVMVTNQDGLGTDAFPRSTFQPIQDLMLRTLKGEGVVFDEILIDTTFAKDNAPTRKPRTGLLTKYFSEEYDLETNNCILFTSTMWKYLGFKEDQALFDFLVDGIFHDGHLEDTVRRLVANNHRFLKAFVSPDAVKAHVVEVVENILEDSQD